MGLFDVFRRKKESTVDWTKRQPVPEFTRIIEAKRYSTLDSKMVAQGPAAFGWHPAYAWMFQTQAGNFFSVFKNLTHPDDFQILIPERDSARTLYESLRYQEVPYEQVFPEFKVTDA